ncbi:MAG: hypothetical protein GY928_34450 [Colwellia sp.]|nr:hypothetical protein [Colwellia sp.]
MKIEVNWEKRKGQVGVIARLEVIEGHKSLGKGFFTTDSNNTLYMPVNLGGYSTCHVEGYTVEQCQIRVDDIIKKVKKIVKTQDKIVLPKTTIHEI